MLLLVMLSFDLYISCMTCSEFVRGTASLIYITCQRAELCLSRSQKLLILYDEFLSLCVILFLAGLILRRWFLTYSPGRIEFVLFADRASGNGFCLEEHKLNVTDDVFCLPDKVFKCSDP